MNLRLYAAPLLVLALAGCQSSKSGKAATITPPKASAAASTAAAPSSAVAAPAAPSSSAAAPSAQASSAAPAAAAQIGSSVGFTYTDGLIVSVLSAKKFTADPAGLGVVAGDAAVLLQIRITNGTKAAFDLSLAQVTVHAGANGDQGAEIYQSGPPDLGGGFSGSIAPGQSATAPFGFDVPAADLPGISVSVTPDFNHNDATFVGTVS